MDNQNTLKTFAEGICPHCSEKVQICYVLSLGLHSVLTPEDSDKAKADIIEGIKALDIPEEKKLATIKSFKDNVSPFTPDDVEPIIQAILEREKTKEVPKEAPEGETK